MATYQELYALQTDDDLRQKIAVATVVAAQAKLAGTPTAAEAAWAKEVIQYPIGDRARSVMNLVLAANKGADVSVIQSASDASIQTNVDAVVDGLIAAG
jgi:hypothetical protein